MNKQHRNRVIDTENTLMVVRGEGNWGLGEKGECIKSHKWVVTE